MASHVVVVDSTARKYTIKTTPTKYLSDVLQEACAKFGVSPDQYSLKHNNKQVDLSRTIRLSGLSPGAKLQLVQASRSPSVVSVALQLPPSWATSATPTRLTDKFPSSTSIWQILRKFESGVAGGVAAPNANLNFTQRGTAQVQSGQSGLGRLFYEMPVVNVMGRDLTSFQDLQRNLAQLGLNSGSCLLRLSFRNTQQPLEEAMTEISAYFTEVEQPLSRTQGVPEDSTAEEVQNSSEVEPSLKVDPIVDHQNSSTMDTDDPSPFVPSNPTSHTDASLPPDIKSEDGSLGSPIAIFAPPSNSTPASATKSNFNDGDYIPTIDHAKYHQARLASESRNRKLLSDAEMEAERQSRATALSEVKEVVVRMRFPDQSQAQKTFGQDAQTSDLYSTCRDLMARPKNEGFTIRAASQKGIPTSLLDGNERLIMDLGWQGRILVTIVWDDGVGADTRNQPSLKEEYRQKAEKLKVDEVSAKDYHDDDKGKAQSSSRGSKDNDGGSSGGDKEAKFKRFLKGLSKK